MSKETLVVERFRLPLDNGLYIEGLHQNLMKLWRRR